MKKKKHTKNKTSKNSKKQNRPKIDPKKGKSKIKEVSEKQEASVKELENDNLSVISFKHLDPNQGQSFKNWEQDHILANAMEALHGFCQDKWDQFNNDKFTIYGDFPSPSGFNYPQHVYYDAKWARLKVKGLQVIAGHIVNNKFYIVFLDKNHQFYITKKKNT